MELGDAAYQLLRLQCTPALWRMLEAARVPASLVPQSFGCWEIARFTPETQAERVAIGFSTQTRLYHQTWGTLHHEHGALVMEDSWHELAKHLPIWLAAQGHVLVTGLGLGCVVRGLLSKPAVEHITVVEIDPGICTIVGREFADEPRVTLIQADALTVDITGAHFDYGWHDLFQSDDEKPALQVLHAELLVRYERVCRHQGAWGFPRMFKRCWPAPLLGSSHYYHRRAR